jgi:hypothetical protein
MGWRTQPQQFFSRSSGESPGSLPGVWVTRWKTHHECIKIIDSKAFHISGYPHLFGAVDPLAAKIHAGVVASGWHSPRSGWRVATCDASYGGCEVDWDTTPSGAQPNADARDRRRCQLEDLRSGMFLTILGGLKIRWVWVKVQMIFVHPPK